MSEPIKPPRGWIESQDSGSVYWRRLGNRSGGLMYDFEKRELDIWSINWLVPKCLPLFRQRVKQLRLERETE